jgi:hypothetical protein
MKYIRHALLALFLFALPLNSAVNLKFQWDAKLAGDTRTHVRIYEKVTGTPVTYTQLAEVPEPVVNVTITGVLSGTHSYVARGWNGQEESADSNVVTITVLTVPGVPTNVTITIVIG